MIFPATSVMLWTVSRDAARTARLALLEAELMMSASIPDVLGPGEDPCCCMCFRSHVLLVPSAHDGTFSSRIHLLTR